MHVPPPPNYPPGLLSEKQFDYITSSAAKSFPSSAAPRQRSEIVLKMTAISECFTDPAPSARR